MSLFFDEVDCADQYRSGRVLSGDAEQATTDETMVASRPLG
jgi:hypothetical protein